jgi:hypothetical protein
VIMAGICKNDVPARAELANSPLAQSE